MKKFKITTNFRVSNINFQIILECVLLKKTIIESNTLHDSNLNFQYKSLLIKEILKILSDNNDGLRINNIPTSSIYTRILQLYDNSYFVLIGNDLYPIKIKNKINVITDPFELITVN